MALQTLAVHALRHGARKCFRNIVNKCRCDDEVNTLDAFQFASVSPLAASLHPAGQLHPSDLLHMVLDHACNIHGVTSECLRESALHLCAYIETHYGTNSELNTSDAELNEEDTKLNKDNTKHNKKDTKSNKYNTKLNQEDTELNTHGTGSHKNAFARILSILCPCVTTNRIGIAIDGEMSTERNKHRHSGNGRKDIGTDAGKALYKDTHSHRGTSTGTVDAEKNRDTNTDINEDTSTHTDMDVDTDKDSHADSFAPKLLSDNFVEKIRLLPSVTRHLLAFSYKSKSAKAFYSSVIKVHMEEYETIVMSAESSDHHSKVMRAAQLQFAAACSGC